MMKAWDFTRHIDPNKILYNTYGCPYCHSKLKWIKIADLWPIEEEVHRRYHKGTTADYKRIHGLEDCYLTIRPDGIGSAEVHLGICKVCGWWHIEKIVDLFAQKWQIWQIIYGCSGVLQNLDLRDVRLELEEIRNFLSARYQHRFSVNPRRFEETVCSVFKSNGYSAVVTGFTHDGGIDVVLESQKGSHIGIQVKRYKNNIQVEQIRSFVGALILGGFTKGIYVTTSGFSLTSNKLIHNNLPVPIELMDANRFYDALKIAQVNDFNQWDYIALLERRKIPKLFPYMEYPMNSL